MTRQEAISVEAGKVKAALGSLPSSSLRCVTCVARRILLDGPYCWYGMWINPVAKSLGAGVWEITHKKE